MIFLMETVTGRMGCVPILPINVTFVTESLCVNEPLSWHSLQLLEFEMSVLRKTLTIVAFHVVSNVPMSRPIMKRSSSMQAPLTLYTGRIQFKVLTTLPLKILSFCTVNSVTYFPVVTKLMSSSICHFRFHFLS